MAFKWPRRRVNRDYAMGGDVIHLSIRSSPSHTRRKELRSHSLYLFGSSGEGSRNQSCKRSTRLFIFIIQDSVAQRDKSNIVGDVANLIKSDSYRETTKRVTGCVLTPAHHLGHFFPSSSSFSKGAAHSAHRAFALLSNDLCGTYRELYS